MAVLFCTFLVVIFTRVSAQAGFIPDTRVQFNSAIIAFTGAVLGPLAGAVTAFMGHTIGDALFSNKIWWSWVAADTLYGFATGLVYGRIKLSQIRFKSKQALIFNLNQFMANAVAWIFVAPLLDIIIYGEPKDVVVVQGVTAFAINGAVTLVIGTILVFVYSKLRSCRTGLQKQA